jgi:phosphohistidine phosphatase
MNLYIIRHAIAEERRADLPDSERTLTEKGRSRFALHTQALERLELEFGVLLHSPWKRAVETALFFQKLAHEMRPTDLLAQSPSEELIDLIARTGTSVAVVGHEPWLSELLAWLVVGAREHGGSFELKKGAVAHLSGEPRPGAMQLRALMQPTLLRIAGSAR